MRGKATKKAEKTSGHDDIRAEYNFSGGVRGKYAEQYKQGTNVVIVDPDLTKAFPDSKSVNDALRGLLAIATRTQPKRRRT